MPKNDLAIILIGAQLGENIGTAARAMLNFGLAELRLVRPRPDWQLDRALKASAGAEALIENRREFETTKEAICDLTYVVATTARLRDMVKPVYTPQAAIAEIRKIERAPNGRAGILFGPERSGLDNNDISLADALCRVPLNPAFSSLNLAQAVLLIAYEYFQSKDETAAQRLPMADTRPARRDELTHMFAHFEAALDASGFLEPPEKKPAMIRNLRNMFHRAALTEQDIRTFRGVINALLRWPRELQDEVVKPRLAEISRGSPDPAKSEQKKGQKKDEKA